MNLLMLSFKVLQWLSTFFEAFLEYGICSLSITQLFIVPSPGLVKAANFTTNILVIHKVIDLQRLITGSCLNRNELPHKISNNVVCANSKTSDQPAQKHSLIRAVSSRLSIQMSVKLLTEQHLEFICLKGGFTGWFESTLVKIPHCWQSDVTAQIRF